MERDRLLRRLLSFCLPIIREQGPSSELYMSLANKSGLVDIWRRTGWWLNRSEINGGGPRGCKIYKAWVYREGEAPAHGLDVTNYSLNDAAALVVGVTASNRKDIIRLYLDVVRGIILWVERDVWNKDETVELPDRNSAQATDVELGLFENQIPGWWK